MNDWQSDLFGGGDLSARLTGCLRAVGATDGELKAIQRIPTDEGRELAAFHVIHLHRRGSQVLACMVNLFRIREREGRLQPIGSDRIWGSCGERWPDRFPGSHEHRAFYVWLFWHLCPDLRGRISIDGPCEPSCKPLFDAGFPAGLTLEQFLTESDEHD